MLLLLAALSLEPELGSARRAGAEANAAVGETLAVPVEPARVETMKQALDRVAAAGRSAAAAVEALAAKLAVEEPEGLDRRLEELREAAEALEPRRRRLLEKARDLEERARGRKTPEGDRKAGELKTLGESIASARLPGGRDLKPLEEARWDVRNEARRARSEAEGPSRLAEELRGREAPLAQSIQGARRFLDKLDVEPRNEHRTRVYERLSEVKDHGQAVSQACAGAAAGAEAFAQRRRALEKAAAAFDAGEKALKKRLEDSESVLAALERSVSEHER